MAQIPYNFFFGFDYFIVDRLRNAIPVVDGKPCTSPTVALHFVFGPLLSCASFFCQGQCTFGIDTDTFDRFVVLNKEFGGIVHGDNISGKSNSDRPIVFQ
ncbi:hypothetical protein D3C81_1328610 [compost metagenome]